MIIVRAVKQGRDAIAHRAWAGAFRTLAKADRQRPLGPQDLEHLALAAYMLGRSDDHLEYLKRAQRAVRSGPGSILRRVDGLATRPAGLDVHSVSPIADPATT